jgi:NADH dehydrogenase FAD-containing subunit
MSPVPVSLLSRRLPLGGSWAKIFVEQALKKLGVTIENVSVEELHQVADGAIRVKRTANQAGAPTIDDDNSPFDAVFWTAGSKPPDLLPGLHRTESGRLAVRLILQCIHNDGTAILGLWAIGDCA